MKNDNLTKEEINKLYMVYNNTLRFDITKFKNNKEIVIEVGVANLLFLNFGTPCLVNLN
ncbi:MAG: hypothetical protein ACOCVF_04020 [bacterium]